MAVMSLPEQYRRRLRTTKRHEEAEPGGAKAGASHPYLSERRIGAAAHRGCADGDGRGLVNRPSLLRYGRILAVESKPRSARGHNNEGRG